MRQGILISILTLFTVCSLCLSREMTPSSPDDLHDAQLIAIVISGELTPPVELTEAIYNDLLLIKSAYPEIADIHYRPTYSPKTMIIGLTNQAMTDFKNGQYHALDELNVTYGVVGIKTFDFINAVVLQFDQIYNIELLSEIYENTVSEGIRYVEPDYMIGDGDTIIPDPPIYTFIRAWGDCPAGCIFQEYYYFHIKDEQVRLVDPDPGLIADAGEDQVVFAWVAGYALTQLDGTRSFSVFGKSVDYYWFDVNDLIATGAEPNVVLPVGEHVIDLVVSDGIADSEPNACVVTVIEPFETTARVMPGVINLKANRPKLNGRIEFTGTEMPVLDPNQPMLLLVGDAQIESQDQKLVYSEEDNAWYLRGTFDSAAVYENLTGFDEAEIILVSRFDSGQWLYGMDIVRIK